MENKEILVVLLNEFADWESAFISTALNSGVKPGRPSKYVVKTLSVTKDPVATIGGMRALPDYDLASAPHDFSGLILIGGMQWFGPEARQLLPLVEKALNEKKVVAAICNASVYLAINGFLNDVKHTSNTLDYLKSIEDSKYTGEANYINEQAVRDGNIITANGTGYLEFCRETLYALEADEPQYIEDYYNFNKLGMCEFIKQMHSK